MKLISFVSLLLLFSTLGCKNYQPTERKQELNSNHFISFTDIHFNPFADSTIVKILNESEYYQWDSIFQTSNLLSYGNYGHEANYTLFTEALSAMKLNNPNPDFLIIAGDFICHDFGETFHHYTKISSKEEMHTFMKKTMQFMVAMIKNAYPNTTIFPTLGNNDAYCGDYQIDMDGEYLDMFANLFYPIIDQEKDDSTIVYDLKMDGCYVATNPFKTDHKIISFNSIVFTPKYQSIRKVRHCDYFKVNQDSLANVQFVWLEKQLKICKQNKQNVWLLTHVPPGIDVFASLRKEKIVSYWVEKYTEAFKTIINKYNPLIKVIMVGHTHMDDFKVVFNNENPESYIHITQSISPIFDNNPGYQVVFYDTTNATFTNYHSFNVELNDTLNVQWQKEYDYNETFGLTLFTPKGINKLYKRIKTDSTLRQHYFDYYPSNSTHGSFINSENWDAYKCGMVNILDQNYSDCVAP